jgi:hypothetical protein
MVLGSKKIKTWIQYLELPLQIVLLQEHHLSETQHDRYENRVELKNGVVFWNLGLQLRHVGV